MGTTMVWERTETAGELLVTVADSTGPVTGATVVVAVRDAETVDSWLDFSDGVFKTAGWVTRQQAMVEVGALAPGVYRLTLDLTAITLPVASDRLSAEYEVTAPTGFPVDVDRIELVQNIKALPVQTDIVSDGVPFPGVNVDAPISNVEADTQDIQNRLPAALVGGRMDSDVGALQAGVITAAVLATDAIGSAQLALSAVNEIRDSILADSTPFNGADIGAILVDTGAMQPLVDVAVSSRSAPGDAMGLTASAVDGIWDEDVVAAHGTPSTAGLLLRSLGASISARTNSPDLNALLGVPDSAGVDLPAQVDAVLSAAHGAGAWDAVGSGLTQQQVRDAMLLAPSPGAPAAGSVDEALDNIEADTAAMEPLVSLNLDAQVSTRSSHTPAQAATSVWSEPVPGTFAAGSAGSVLGTNLDALVSGRAAPGDAMTLTAGERTAIDAELTAAHGAGSWNGDTAANIAQAVWAEPVPGAFGAGEAGQVLGANLDAQVSSRAVPGDAMALTPAERTAVSTDLLGQSQDTFSVLGTVGGSLAAASAFAGRHVVDDNYSFAGSPPGQPKSFRRRQFATAAEADAARAAPGAADGADGEIKRWKAVADYTGTTANDVLVAMSFVEEL